MLNFRRWLVESDVSKASDEIALMRACFASRFDRTPILVYADWLDDHPEVGAGRIDVGRLTAIMRQVADGTKTRWGGELHMLQYYIHQQLMAAGNWDVNDHHRGQIYYILRGKDERSSTTLMPFANPGETIYRVSLNNGQWSMYHHPEAGDGPWHRMAIIPRRNIEGHAPYHGTLGMRPTQMTPVDVMQVPDALIVDAYWRVIEWLTESRR